MTPEQYARQIIDGLDAARRASSMARPVNEVGLIEAAVADAIDDTAKRLAYSEQENAVLHARVRQLEISLSSEREACAKVAEEYWRRPSYEAFTDPQRVTLHIASLIRGRGEK